MNTPLPFGRPIESPANPQKMTMASFLVGPARWRDYEDVLEINDFVAKSLDHIMIDLLRFAPADLNLDVDQPITRALHRPHILEDWQMYFVPVRCGLLITNQKGRVYGGYLSTDVAIATEIRGEGYGVELILEYFMRNGQLPTWNLDTASYSHAGYASHKAAWRLAAETYQPTQGQKRRVFVEKTRRLKKNSQPQIIPDIGLFARKAREEYSTQRCY